MSIVPLFYFFVSTFTELQFAFCFTKGMLIAKFTANQIAT